MAEIQEEGVNQIIQFLEACYNAPNDQQTAMNEASHQRNLFLCSLDEVISNGVIYTRKNSI